MAKLPAFQFYPGDWLKDPDLRICSPFARALLVDLLCLCFEAKRRGVLAKANGAPWTAKDVYTAVGTGMSLDQVESAMRELEENGVLKRDEPTGCLYSARMVRDEEIRQTRKQAGSKGGNKRAANAKANTQAKGQAKTGSSSSSSSSKKDNVGETPPGDSPSEKFTPEDRHIAEQIFAQIRQLNAKHREPDFSNWADTIRLMRERDGRTHAEILAMFAWANNHPFWKTNILCPDKLRKQWDVLTIQRNSNQSGVVDLSDYGRGGI